MVALDEFQALGVGFVSHQEAIDTSTPMGRMFFAITGAFAGMERELIRERVSAGLRRAKSAGTRLGRPKVDVDIESILELTRQGKSLRSTAKKLGVSKDVISARLREAENDAKLPHAS